MPYASTSELPQSILNHVPTGKGRRLFMAVFNNALGRGQEESAAFRQAWGALQNAGYRKGEDGQWRKVEKMDALIMKGYDPRQPRWPEGSKKGGRWKSKGGGGSSGAGAAGSGGGTPSLAEAMKLTGAASVAELHAKLKANPKLVSALATAAGLAGGAGGAKLGAKIAGKAGAFVGGVAGGQAAARAVNAFAGASTPKTGAQEALNVASSIIGGTAGKAVGTAVGGPLGGVVGGVVGAKLLANMSEGVHPRLNDKGEPVVIKKPTPSSLSETWADRNERAVWGPDTAVPEALNGVAVKSWDPPKTAEGWNKVEGQKQLNEKPVPLVKGPFGPKRIGAGVVVGESDGRVWIVEPTNHFGGYQASFPKGGKEKGVNLQASAIKEAWEESGLKVEITGILGDFEGDTSISRYYTARRTGGSPADMGWETQSVQLVPAAQLTQSLNRQRDKDIAAEFLGSTGLTVNKRAGAALAIAIHKVLLEKYDPRQPRYPSGHKHGGRWRPTKAGGGGGGGKGKGGATGGAGAAEALSTASGLTGSGSTAPKVTPPPKIGSAKNPGYQAKVDAMYEAALAGNVAAVKGATFGKNTYGKASAKYQDKLLSDLAALREAGLPSDSSPAAIKAGLRSGSKMTLADMTYTAPKPGGSNPGGIYTDKAGAKWLVKGSGGNPEFARNEILAARLYNAAGAHAPEMRPVELGGEYGGGIGVASRMLGGGMQTLSSKSAKMEATKDFAADAWLGNWDSVGLSNDNIVINDKGEAVRIDPGGSILYRAQGAKKPPGAFGESVTEWDSMRGPVAGLPANNSAWGVYGKMTASELQASAAKLAGVSDDTIKTLVDRYGPGSGANKADLADIIIARRDDVLARAAAMSPEKPAAAAPVQAATVVAKPPAETLVLPDINSVGMAGAFNKSKAAEVQAIHALAAKGDFEGVKNYTAYTQYGVAYAAATLMAAGLGDETVTFGSAKTKANDAWYMHAPQALKDQVGGPEGWKTAPVEPAAAAPAQTAKPGTLPLPKVKNAAISVTMAMQKEDVDNIHALAAKGDFEGVKNYETKTSYSAAYAAATLMAAGLGDESINLEGSKIKSTHAWNVYSSASLTNEIGTPNGWKTATKPAATPPAGAGGATTGGILGNVVVPPKPKINGALKQKDADALHAMAAKGNLAGVQAYKPQTFFGAKYAAAIMVANGKPDATVQTSYASGGMKAGQAWNSATDKIKNEIGDPNAWAAAKQNKPKKTAEETAAANIATLASIPDFTPPSKWLSDATSRFYGDVSRQIDQAIKAGDLDHAKQLAEIPPVKSTDPNNGIFHAYATLAIKQAEAKQAAKLKETVAVGDASSLPKPSTFGLAEGAMFVGAMKQAGEKGELNKLKDMVANPALPPAQKKYGEALIARLGGDSKPTTGAPDTVPFTSKSLLPQHTKYGMPISSESGNRLLTMASNGELGALKAIASEASKTSEGQYAKALVDHLENKWSSNTAWANQYGKGTGAGTGQTTTTSTTALGSAAKAKPAVKAAMPDFDAYLLPDTNTNAGPHNKQINAIKDAAQAGNAAGILAMGFGSNTYAKKQVKLANDALAALGSDQTVAIKQKKGTHPGLTGAEIAAGKPTVPKDTAAKPVVKPVFDPNKVTRPPDFENWQGQGKGLSSVDAINANNKAVSLEMFNLAKTGDVAALKAYQFPQIDKATGAPTGKLLPISQHPSQHIKAYHSDLLQNIHDQLNPPAPVASVRLTPGSVFEKFASTYPTITVEQSAKHADKVGRYAVLGSVSESLHNEARSAVADMQKLVYGGELTTGTYYKPSWDSYNKNTSAVQKAAIKDYTGSSYASMNNQIQNGNPGAGAKAAINGLEAASIPLVPGTVLSRKISLDQETLNKIWASRGKVLQDTAIISTSINPNVWHGNVQLRIFTGEGAKGLFVGKHSGKPPISLNPNEGEIILGPRSRFLILETTKQKPDPWFEGGKNVYVDALLLPH